MRRKRIAATTVLQRVTMCANCGHSRANHLAGFCVYWANHFGGYLEYCRCDRFVNPKIDDGDGD